VPLASSSVAMAPLMTTDFQSQVTTFISLNAHEPQTLANLLINALSKMYENVDDMRAIAHGVRVLKSSLSILVGKLDPSEVEDNDNKGKGKLSCAENKVSFLSFASQSYLSICEFIDCRSKINLRLTCSHVHQCMMGCPISDSDILDIFTDRITARSQFGYFGPYRVYRMFDQSTASDLYFKTVKLLLPFKKYNVPQDKWNKECTCDPVSSRVIKSLELNHILKFDSTSADCPSMSELSRVGINRYWTITGIVLDNIPVHRLIEGLNLLLEHDGYRHIKSLLAKNPGCMSSIQHHIKHKVIQNLEEVYISVDVNHCQTRHTTVELFQNLANLRKLHLKNCGMIGDLSKLHHLTNLTHLVSNAKSNSLFLTGEHNVSKLVKLKHLELALCGNFDFNHFGSLTRLEHFSLRTIQFVPNADMSMYHQNNVSSICGLSSLKYLHLDGGPNLSGDMSSLGNHLTNLEALLINNDVNLSCSLSDLTSMTKLKTLICENMGEKVFGNLSSLSSLTSLTDLQFSRTEVSGDIKHLSPLLKLKNLHLTDTPVFGVKFTLPLKVLIALSHRCFSGTSVINTSVPIQLNESKLVEEETLPYYDASCEQYEKEEEGYIDAALDSEFDCAPPAPDIEFEVAYYDESCELYEKEEKGYIDAALDSEFDSAPSALPDFDELVNLDISEGVPEPEDEDNVNEYAVHYHNHLSWRENHRVSRG
jgi:hypothetical protein